MKKRTITACFWVVLIVGFFLLKIFVNKLFFDGLLVTFSVIGTYEMLHAFGDKISKSQKWATAIFSFLLLITYIVTDLLYRYGEPDGIADRNYASQITFITLMASVSTLFMFTVFDPEKATIPSTGNAVLCLIYPNAFVLALIACNHLPDQNFSNMAIIIIFALVPIVDTCAFLVGSALGKKIPYKLAPRLSPNKTVVGGVGGLLGGILGGILLMFLFVWWGYIEYRPMEIFFYASLGGLTAVFATIGDLVESAIKRSLGIKDMGNILPGHGGILDRIDSALFAGLIVCFVFVMRLMATGV